MYDFKIKVFYLIRRHNIIKETFSFAIFRSKYFFSNVAHKVYNMVTNEKHLLNGVFLFQ